MKIAFLSDLFYPFMGGGEMYLLNLEKELIKMGHEVVNITSRLPNTQASEEMDGIQIIRTWIPKNRFFFPLSVLSKLGKVDADVFQTQPYPAAFTGWMFGKRMGKPNVLFCHEFNRKLWDLIRDGYFEKKFYPLLENYIASLPYDWYITPSEYSKNSLIDAGVDGDKITVIYHGIDEKFREVDSTDWRAKYGLEGKKTFGFFGRLNDPQKGMKYLLEAAKIVFKEIPDSRLVLAGSGYESVELSIKELGIDKSVVYLGKIPMGEEPKFYSLLDVFTGASVVEGFGFVYVEASKCGKPVVATTAASLPEIVNEKTGILVPIRNPKRLAESIITLLKDDKLARRLGRNGKKYTRKFTWKNSAEKHLEVYEKLAC